MLARPVDRDLYIVDPAREPLVRLSEGARHPYGQSAGDRLRIGYGKLTIYLGAVAGSGKTYAMLDRAHQLLDEGVDVVGGFVETHGRVDTAAKLEGIDVLPRLPNGELDREALVARRPKVALIDELAHTNAAGSPYPKRFDDVIAVLRAGISVITTLNIQHLAGLGDAVERLTGMKVRETLPDSILELGRRRNRRRRDAGFVARTATGRKDLPQGADRLRAGQFLSHREFGRAARADRA